MHCHWNATNRQWNTHTSAHFSQFQFQFRFQFGIRLWFRFRFGFAFAFRYRLFCILVGICCRLLTAKDWLSAECTGPATRRSTRSAHSPVSLANVPRFVLGCSSDRGSSQLPNHPTIRPALLRLRPPMGQLLRRWKLEAVSWASRLGILPRSELELRQIPQWIKLTSKRTRRYTRWQMSKSRFV